MTERTVLAVVGNWNAKKPQVGCFILTQIYSFHLKSLVLKIFYEGIHLSEGVFTWYMPVSHPDIDVSVVFLRDTLKTWNALIVFNSVWQY